MKKPKSTTKEIALDKNRRREFMAENKPKEKASECFKRAPYTMNKEVKTNE